MAKQCKATTRKGTHCPNAAGKSGYCFVHDPARGKERARARKRGGQNRTTPKVADVSTVKTPIRDVAGVMSILDVATVDTLAQDNGAQRTRALVAVALAYFKGLEVGEVESRLAQIEQALGLAQKGVTIVESQNANGQGDGTSAGASEGENEKPSQ